MINKEVLSNLEKQTHLWSDLDKIVVSDGRQIMCVDNPVKIAEAVDKTLSGDFVDDFYVVVRTYYNRNKISNFLREVFIKTYSISVEEIASEDVDFKTKKYLLESLIKVYVIRFKILYPEYWEFSSKLKLAYYSILLILLTDYPFCGEQTLGDTFMELLGGTFRSRKNLNLDLFFFPSLGHLLNVIKEKRYKKATVKSSLILDGPDISSNIEGIIFVMSTKDQLTEALERINNFDADEITNSLLLQFDEMRMNL